MFSAYPLSDEFFFNGSPGNDRVDLDRLKHFGNTGASLMTILQMDSI